MQKPPLLYLVHRIPYPPNKGDKVRSFNLLKYFAQHYRVYLGAFIDDPADAQNVAALSEWCEGLHCEPISRRWARIASLRGLVTGEALTLAYYRQSSMLSWVKATVAEHRIRDAAVFCSAMMQYIEAVPGLNTLADYCDVDSAKWTQYAEAHRGPMAWLYRREGRKLLAYERHAAEVARAVTFVSEAEADLFRAQAPEVAARVLAVSNGVNAAYFSPDHDLQSPYPESGPNIVFTGAMDYWPNIDAVRWFVREAWPAVAAMDRRAQFWIVGMNPSPEVQALAADARIHVTGTVPDVRPYLRDAAAVVAPLRVARGVQNKVLEAMAMGRPVIVSNDAATGINAVDGKDFLIARTGSEYVEAIKSLLADADRAHQIGTAARRCVLDHYSWDAHLAQLDVFMLGASQA
ncbi:TIGR03087 family PEP-CTERM/XrtA system glycosyltransferase [Niveibacterium sp.]|uniref:TIGR03087 family PEP-CTERM/XrtA system glycosyltransferase n=1 Tax=Niveibacterium sp. TaxID=2017444 RepID=UPI0035B341BF